MAFQHRIFLPPGYHVMVGVPAPPSLPSPTTHGPGLAPSAGCPKRASCRRQQAARAVGECWHGPRAGVSGAPLLQVVAAQALHACPLCWGYMAAS